MVEKKPVEAQRIQNLNMSQKDEEEDQQTHNQLRNQGPPVKKKPPNRKTPNMSPIGTIAGQKPTGTRKTRDM